jgi:hypothetical protein
MIPVVRCGPRPSLKARLLSATENHSCLYQPLTSQTVSAKGEVDCRFDSWLQAGPHSPPFPGSHAPQPHRYATGHGGEHIPSLLPMLRRQYSVSPGRGESSEAHSWYSGHDIIRRRIQNESDANSLLTQSFARSVTRLMSHPGRKGNINRLHNPDVLIHRTNHRGFLSQASAFCRSSSIATSSTSRGHHVPRPVFWRLAVWSMGALESMLRGQAQSLCLLLVVTIPEGITQYR